jgi:hypothetical protein
VRVYDGDEQIFVYTSLLLQASVEPRISLEERHFNRR